MNLGLGTIKAGVLLLGITACNWQVPTSDEGLMDTARLETTDTVLAKDALAHRSADSLPADGTQNRDTVFLPPSQTIDTKDTDPQALVNFARTLVGTPYVYGSTDPKRGFDCSGFITYVFNHFGIGVPRSSVEFTHVGREVPAGAAKRGDLILFTGTNPAERHVGHMGIVITNPPDSLQFIHSTSGKAMGVTVTPLNEYYRKRFVKVIRIFPH